jgi:hypothetical protein
LAAVALWGAVAVAGTNVLLAFSDSYSTWVLVAGLDGDTDLLVDRLVMLLIPSAALSPGLVAIVGAVVTFAVFAQVVVLLFRNGAVIILTGLLQFAAAGAFTAGTSGWLRKVLTWHLALIFYKPLAATIYAIAFMLVGHDGNDLHVWLTGIGMLTMTIIALPAMLRFLNWSIGGIQTSSGSVGMLAAAGAAGAHAAASIRGVTGHASDMQRRYADTGPTFGAGSGGGGSAGGRTGPPVFTGVPATTAATAGTATGATAASGATTGAAGATTATAAAAAGPAAPVVAGVVMAGQATAGAVRKGADTAARGMRPEES